MRVEGKPELTDKVQTRRFVERRSTKHVGQFCDTYFKACASVKRTLFMLVILQLLY